MKVGIITVSDKGSQGERKDISGKVIEQMARSKLAVDSIEYAIVPDEQDLISAKLTELADNKKCQLILTNGGTGLAVRDVTPEATLKVIDRLVPGIPEAMRQASLKYTPLGMLSRGMCGVRKKCLIINLPGSPKAVRENLEVVLPALAHAIEILEKGSLECARGKK